MAVKAASEVTITDNTDIDSLVTWYYLTTSATKPAAPTTTQTSQTPPSPWTQAEPTFSAGTVTNYLYTCVQTRWKDGSCTWGAVQLSSAYEQAKQAWNKAQAAYDATQPIASKTYTGIIGTANTAADASFYFAKVHPDDYNGVWQVKLRINVTEPVLYQEIVDVTVSGRASAFMAYDAVSHRSNSALAIYYLNLYRAKQAGITAGKGHALGFGLRSSTNPINATYARTITVEVLEQVNCTVQLLDSAVKYANMDGTGTTNYDGLTELYIGSYGQNATNNANTYDRTLYNSNVKAATNLTAGRIVCGNSVGYNNIAAGMVFDISYPLLYNNTAYNAGGVRGDLDLVRTNIAFSNNGTIENAAQHSMVYLKGTVIGNAFTIAASPFMTCKVPTSADGYCYLPLGRLRDSTANGQFTSTHELWCFKDGAFGPVSLREASQAAKTATNYITKQGSGDTWIHAEGMGPDSSNNPTSATRGWRIGEALDLFRGTVSHFRVWLDETLDKVRVRIGDAASGHVVLDDSGMEVLNGTTSVASFGSTARVGKAGESHVEIDFHSLQLIDKEGTDYFHISDLRDSEGFENGIVEQIGVGDGYTVDFRLSKRPGRNLVVTADGSPLSVTSQGGIDTGEWDIDLSPAPPNGSVVVASYDAYGDGLKAYTFGKRGNGDIGAFSYALGRNVVASGLTSFASGVKTVASGKNSFAEGCRSVASGDSSHAEGDYGTTASGRASHAEGYQTESSDLGAHSEGSNTAARGYASHAEGMYTIASGKYSHAQGRQTKASSDFQTVLGKYNVEDADDTYAVILGNGTSNSARSNALTVDWDGNVEAMGEVTAHDSNNVAHNLTEKANSSDVTSALAGKANAVHSHDFTDVDSANGRQCYPLFVYNGKPTEANAPVKPCFVYDTSDNGLYYYSG